MNITIPELGEDFDQVDVAEIAVSVGDSVAVGDTLITLESDKAAMDIPAEVEGVVAEIRVAVGDKVSPGDVFIVLNAASDSAPAESEPSPAEPAEAPAASTAAAESNNTQTVLCPELGDDFETVDIAEVAVKVGDAVQKDDTLITLESDKAAMDIPSPYDGVITEMHVQVGGKISPGDAIATMTLSEAAGVAPSPEAPAAAKAESAPPPPKLEAAAPPTKAPPAPSAPVEPTSSTANASPSVRKFARELGANLDEIKGTGRKGRILHEDVQQYVKQRLAGASAAAPYDGTGTVGLEPLPVVDFSKFGETEQQPLSRIKQITGQNLGRSWPQVPQVTQFDEADVTDLEAFRKSQAKAAEKRGTKLTILPLVVKAVVHALKMHPEFNASLAPDGKHLIVKKYYNIGIAVDTPGGLLVPVIKEADKKSVFDIAEELIDVSKRGRERKLMPGEMQGSNLTISSLGGVGGTAFTPIVTPPEVAILGLSRSQIKPVWDGAQFQPRTMLPLSLSYDHRVIDGVLAVRFTRAIATALEDLRVTLL